jgi:serine/threonine-protein kinase
VFLAARDRDGDEHGTFLAAECAGDDDFRAEVESLLAADRDADRVDALAESWRDPWGAAPAPSHGKRVGPYRLLEIRGSGGMGTVWLAERDDDQFRQQVALKLLRAEANTPELRRRFRNERQILARLTHPNIARLHDGGITDDGRPWFAMEHVPGQPLDRFCAERGLTVRERVALLMQACDAVALQEAVRFAPVDRLLVETDSPYLAPVPFRGKMNEPAWVAEVARKVAQLKGVEAEAVALQAARNTAHLLSLKVQLT